MDTNQARISITIRLTAGASADIQAATHYSIHSFSKWVLGQNSGVISFTSGLDSVLKLDPKVATNLAYMLEDLEVFLMNSHFKSRSKLGKSEKIILQVAKNGVMSEKKFYSVVLMPLSLDQQKKALQIYEEFIPCLTGLWKSIPKISGSIRIISLVKVPLLKTLSTN